MSSTRSQPQESAASPHSAHIADAEHPSQQRHAATIGRCSQRGHVRGSDIQISRAPGTLRNRTGVPRDCVIHGHALQWLGGRTDSNPLGAPQAQPHVRCRALGNEMRPSEYRVRLSGCGGHEHEGGVSVEGAVGLVVADGGVSFDVPGSALHVS